MIARKDIIFKRVLITGANGLLGQTLVQHLSMQPNYDILATAKDDHPRYADASCGYTPLDITDVEETKRVFIDFAPDVVINCAAMTNVDACELNKRDCWKVNVDAVENLARQCRYHGTRLIQLSTDFVFDGANGPYRETDRPDPVNYYGKSKVAAENAVRALPDDYWTIVRTVLVYGHVSDPARGNIVLWVMNNLAEGKEINVVTDQVRSPTYVPDLARGIEKAVRYNKSGVYHLSGREQLSVFEFANIIADVFDYDKNLIKPVDATTFRQAADRPPRTGFIILKAETELGYHPLSVEQALRDMAMRAERKVRA